MFLISISCVSANENITQTNINEHNAQIIANNNEISDISSVNNAKTIPDSITDEKNSTEINEVYVNTNASEDGNGTVNAPFNNLKSAINKINTEGVIYVSPGTYAGQNNVNLTIEKTMNITSLESGDVIFDGEYINQIFHIYSARVNLMGLTFKNSNSTEGNVILIDGNSTVNITNCNFENNFNNHIYIEENSTVFFSNDTITDTLVYNVKSPSVNPNQTFIITAPNIEKYYQDNQRFTITLKDMNNKTLSNETVIISLNGNKYTKKTNENGQTSLAINLPAGIYNAITEYNNTIITSKITVKSTISSDNTTKIFKNGTQYYATLMDTQGNPLINASAEFNINGQFYSRKTNASGVAKLNINLLPGEYIITAKNPNTNEVCGNLITVLSSIVDNNDLVKYFKNNSQYCVKILDETGNPLSDATVEFNINGVFYPRKTNSTGHAKLNINLPPGEYIITATYNSLPVSNKITVLPVLKAKDISMKFMDGTKFEASLVDGQGNPSQGNNITFNINGVFYNRSTDSSGIARLNIKLPIGEYIITSTFNGSAISNKIKISEPDTIIVPNSTKNETEIGNGTFVNANSTYDTLNAFRAEENVWYLNQDNETKTYFNTNETNKLNSLVRDPFLENIAKLRAKELASKFSNLRPNGLYCFSLYPDYITVGENIAMGTNLSGEDAIELWKNYNYTSSGQDSEGNMINSLKRVNGTLLIINQGHRHNMLDPDFNTVGIAGYELNGTVYWVQAFAQHPIPVSNLTENDTFVNASSAYDALNAFRTEDNIWYWNQDNETKTYFNTNETNKLNPLVRDIVLEEVAKIRAKELLQNFSHTRPNGLDCFSVYPDEFYMKGENIAYGTNLSGENATELWKEDNYTYSGQGHRRNMLNLDFNTVGIAGFEYEGIIYWVQAFGKRNFIIFA